MSIRVMIDGSIRVILHWWQHQGHIALMAEHLHPCIRVILHWWQSICTHASVSYCIDGRASAPCIRVILHWWQSICTLHQGHIALMEEHLHPLILANCISCLHFYWRRHIYLIFILLVNQEMSRFWNYVCNWVNFK